MGAIISNYNGHPKLRTADPWGKRFCKTIPDADNSIGGIPIPVELTNEWVNEWTSECKVIASWTEHHLKTIHRAWPAGLVDLANKNIGCLVILEI